jgi:hypothetical protein
MYLMELAPKFAKEARSDYSFDKVKSIFSDLTGALKI